MNVKDALKGLLDLSSLMLDLAYASVIHDNSELAKQVVDLEASINELRDAVLVHMSVAVRSMSDAERSLSVFRAADIASMMAYEAVEVARMVLRGLRLHPKLREGLMEAEESVDIIKVHDGSVFEGLTIEEALMISGVGFNVIAIKSGDRWIINPDESHRIMRGEILVVRGTREALERLRTLVEGDLG
ncbi:MAG: potassium channel protein [Candidatus Bathyarchaeota archaeon B24]|nr:MAG: potassium channel protein [Candidatus Bathyarchaeota archaeon B24]